MIMQPIITESDRVLYIFIQCPCTFVLSGNSFVTKYTQCTVKFLLASHTPGIHALLFSISFVPSNDTNTSVLGNCQAFFNLCSPKDRTLLTITLLSLTVFYESLKGTP